VRLHQKRKAYKFQHRTQWSKYGHISVCGRWATQPWHTACGISTPATVSELNSNLICAPTLFQQTAEQGLRDAYLRWTARTWSHSFSPIAVNDLSRRIPAFAISTCTAPNRSKATFTIASPSSAEHTAGTAEPPPVENVGAAT